MKTTFIIVAIASVFHCCIRWDFIIYIFLKISVFFSAQLVCSKIVGFVSFLKLCSVFANLKLKCLAWLPVMNFYRDMKVYMIYFF